MDAFVCGIFGKVHQMPDFNINGHFVDNDRNIHSSRNEELDSEMDLVMEEILDNLNNTPLGNVLKNIASLSGVRQQKILNVRQQLNEGKYDLNERLNIALDKVLEDLIK